MNERIKKLWAQAGGTFTSGNQHEWPSARIDNPEKFAELLGRECRDMFVVGSVSWNLLNEKLEHFGVEE